jgi:cyclic-di-AMP phosphodiesterase PgpH
VEIFTKIWNRNVEIYKFLMFAGLIAIIVLSFPREGKFSLDYQKGKPWLHENLIATFDFPILKTDEELKLEKSNILKELKPYFKYDIALSNQKKKNLLNNFDSKWKQNSLYKREVNLSVCINICDSLCKRGIIQINDIIEGKPDDYLITLVKNNIAEEKELKNFFTIKTAADYIKKELNKISGIDKSLLNQILQDELAQNVIYDSEITDKEKQLLIENLSSTRGMIQRGQIIISRGEIITADKFNILNSFKKEYSSQIGSPIRYTLILLGQILLVTISVIVLILFLFNFRRTIFNDNKKILLILLLIYLSVFATSIVVKFKPDLIYLVPLCILPIIIRAFFDTRTALFVIIITLIITGYIVPNSFEFVILQLITGIITIISVSKLQNRSQFFLTSLLILFSYSLTFTCISIMQDGSFENIKTITYAYFGANAMLTLFSYPLIFLFEKTFAFITDVSLMELSSTNTPLLRELASKAPGTFQHSMQVANLAEEAIYKIGGNPLLVRTGALYHDIGKVDMPMYFIENQATGSNPHDDLSYEESANIITGHVISGIHKAKSHNLPEEIIDFIRTHHGTTKTMYFYSMYLKNIPDDEPIDESIFTYHGPIPFSKETGIIMMADAVEASSRSLKTYDEQTISNLVETVIYKQIEENQLVNSDITLKDINIIKRIFKKKLMNIYHVRIEYPGA